MSFSYQCQDWNVATKVGCVCDTHKFSIGCGHCLPDLYGTRETEQKGLQHPLGKQFHTVKS